MKNIYLFLVLSFYLFSCEKEQEELYTNNEITYDLFQSSEYPYEGKAVFRELKTGEVEISLRLTGQKDNEPYLFPSHLHFGDYTSPDADIAYLLHPIDIQTLESVTVINQLSNGKKLVFEDIKNLDGHIKIHLADSGPEYDVILVAGNIGSNDNSRENFDKNAITVCGSYFPEY